MSITVANKGLDPDTGLPVTYSADQIIWDRKANCFFVMVTPVAVYPNNTGKVYPQQRQIIQDTPAENYNTGEIITPAMLGTDGVTVITPAVISDGTQIKVPAATAYSNLIAQFPDIPLIGAAMDAYVAGLPNPTQSLQ